MSETPKQIYLSRFWSNYHDHNCQFSYERQADGDIEYVRADLAQRTPWQPIETCPDNTTVLFWDNGPRTGRMEHNVQRLGGQRQDHFWGGLFDDDRPPTHWMPLPDPPEYSK